MGEFIPLILGTILSCTILIVWLINSSGEPKKRTVLLYASLGGLVLAWAWTIPGIYSGEYWKAYMALSFFLVLNLKGVGDN